MRVSQPGNNPVQSKEVTNAKGSDRAASTNASKRSERAAGTSVSAGIAAGKTEISSRAKDLAQAKQIATSAPDVREERIAELKKRIAAGEYKVNAEKVADRMVNDHISSAGIG